MNKNLIAILLSCSLEGSATAAGSCSQPVYSILVGQPAQCTGFLFSPEKEKELRDINEDDKIVKEENDLLTKEVALYKGQSVDLQAAFDSQAKNTALWQANAESANDKYRQLQERQGARDLIFVVLGVALTVAAGYSIGAASHKAAGSIHK